jgi:hypothetical protein
MDGLATRVHCDVLSFKDAWRTIVKRLTPVRIIPASRSPSGYDELNHDRVRANPVPRSLLRRKYLPAKEHES